MSQVKNGKIICSQCGRNFPVRPEHLGKRAKCPCGAVIDVPADALAPAPGAQEEDLYDLAPEPLMNLPGPVSAPTGAAPKMRKCMACGSAVPADAATCPRCGERLKVAAAPSPAGQLRGGGQAFAPTAHTVKMAPEDSRGAMIKLAILCGVLVLLVAGVWMLKSNSRSNDEARAKALAAMKGEDAEATKLMEDEDEHEAKKWLDASEQHGIAGLEWTHDRAVKYVAMFYEHGAKKVSAFGAMQTGALVIELPDGADKRKWFYTWSDGRYSEPAFAGKKPPADLGGKYLIVRFPVGL